MSTFEIATYHLSLYSTEFRWQGELSLPAHRRLSDFINDTDHQFLELKHVVFAVWHDNVYCLQETIDTAVVFKNNLILVTQQEQSEPTEHTLKNRASDRVAKVPQQMVVQIPPFTVQGHWHAPNMVAWTKAINATRADFIPFTNANIRHQKTDTLLGQNVSLAILHRPAIHSIQYDEPAPQQAAA